MFSNAVVEPAVSCCSKADAINRNHPMVRMIVKTTVVIL
jgi:hypothetical protein